MTPLNPAPQNTWGKFKQLWPDLPEPLEEIADQNMKDRRVAVISYQDKEDPNNKGSAVAFLCALSFFRKFHQNICYCGAYVTQDIFLNIYMAANESISNTILAPYFLVGSNQVMQRLCCAIPASSVAA